MWQFLVIRLTARCRTERGASAVEYGLLVFAVAVLFFAGAKALGVTLGAVFGQEQSGLTPAN